MTDFASQPVTWSPSEFDPRVELASIEVPLDHSRPDGDRITVAISRIRCADPSAPAKMLLSLNGGPAGNWGQGIRLPLRFADGPLVRHYDLIGMDPRGTGRSTPLYREDPQPRAGFTTRPADEDFAVIAEDARRMYEGCARAGGPLREQITSANIARDIDLVRRVLGHDRLSFVGYGGPTYIGAVYGTLFGAHLDRMVLDSARNCDLDWRGQFHAQVDGIYANVHSWAEWVGEHDDQLGLGRTSAAVLAAAEEAAHLTDTSQFDVAMGIGTRHRPLWATTAAIVARLRDPDADHADATAAIRLLAALDAWAPGEPRDLVQSVTEAATGEDEWPTDLETYYADMRVARDKYPYGYGVQRFQPQVATFWTDRRMEKPPEIRREAYQPGIVVHGEGNTQLTYADGVATAKRLGFSLVSVRDEGHSEIFAMRGNSAVDDHVLGYLIDGVLPPENVTCPGPQRPDLTVPLPDAGLAAQVEAWTAANRAW